MLSQLGGAAQGGTPLLATFASSVVGLGVVATIASVGAVALEDAIGTIVAVLADFVAPASVVTGLLGGLGLAFGIAARQAFGSGGSLHSAVGKLRDQFDQLSKTLAGRFQLVFKWLVNSASHALTFLDGSRSSP